LNSKNIPKWRASETPTTRGEWEETNRFTEGRKIHLTRSRKEDLGIE